MSDNGPISKLHLDLKGLDPLLKAVQGGGRAGIAVDVPLKRTTKFQSWGAAATVYLTCHQGEQELLAAGQIAGTIATDVANEALKTVETQVPFVRTLLESQNTY